MKPSKVHEIFYHLSLDVAIQLGVGVKTGNQTDDTVINMDNVHSDNNSSSSNYNNNMQQQQQ